MNLKIILLVGLLLGAMAFIAIPVHAMGDNCSAYDNIYPSTITSLLITYPNYNTSNSFTTLNVLDHQNASIYILEQNDNLVNVSLTLLTASQSLNNNTNLGVTRYTDTIGYPTENMCIPSDTTIGTLTPNETITVNGTGLECGAPCYPTSYDFVKPVIFHTDLSNIEFNAVIITNSSLTPTKSTTTTSAIVTTSSMVSTTSMTSFTSFSDSSSSSSSVLTYSTSTFSTISNTTSTSTVETTATNTSTFITNATFTNNVTNTTTRTITQNVTVTNTQNSTIQNLIQKPTNTTSDTTSRTSSSVSLTDIGAISSLSVIGTAAAVIVRRRIS